MSKKIVGFEVFVNDTMSVHAYPLYSDGTRGLRQVFGRRFGGHTSNHEEAAWEAVRDLVRKLAVEPGQSIAMKEVNGQSFVFSLFYDTGTAAAPQDQCEPAPEPEETVDGWTSYILIYTTSKGVLSHASAKSFATVAGLVQWLVEERKVSRVIEVRAVRGSNAWAIPKAEILELLRAELNQTDWA